MLLFTQGGVPAAPPVSTLSTTFVGASLQKITVGNIFRPLKTEKWLFSFWTKVGTGQGGSAFGNIDPLNPNYCGIAFLAFDGTCSMDWIGPTDSTSLTASMSANIWNHVLYAYNGSGQTKVWVNAINQASHSFTPFDTEYTAGSAIAYNDDWGYYTGKLDEMLLATNIARAVTDADAARLYNQGRPADVSSDPLLVGATKNKYSMGEGATAPTMPDEFSVQAGTMVNMTGAAFTNDAA